jgi:PAS domain S-box-containing protein
MESGRRWYRSRWVIAVAYGLAYWILAEASWDLSYRNHTNVTFWMPGGFAFAALLLSDTSLWWALLTAGALANTIFDIRHGAWLGLTLTYVGSNAFQAFVMAYVVRRFVVRTPRLNDLREFLAMAVFSVVLSLGPASLLTAMAQNLAGSGSGYLDTVVTDWMSNAVPILTVSPLVLAWASPSEPGERWWREPLRLVEAAACVLGLVSIDVILMRFPGGGIAATSFIFIPFILWAALRFGVRGASVLNFILSIAIVYGADVLKNGAPPEAMILGGYVPTLYGYLSICSLVGLIPAIALGERSLLLSQLGESEERFRNLAEAANEGIVISEFGRILDINDQILRMFGYRREEIIGRKIEDFVDPEARALVRQRISEDLESPSMHWMVRKDGSKFLGETRPKVMRSGKRALRMAAVRDVTERKQEEALLSGQNQALEMIAAGRPLTEILTRIIGVIESQSVGMLGSILVKDGGVLRHLAGPNLPPEFNLTADLLVIGEGQGSCGTAAHRLQPVMVEDVETSPLWAIHAPLARKFGIRSCWSTPIVDARQRLLGTFALYHRYPCLPTPRQRELIDTVTHIASVAMSRSVDEAALKLSDFSVHQSATPSFWVTRDARIRRVNPAACEVLGYGEQELLSMRATELGLRFQADTWDEDWLGARERKRLRFEQKYTRKDGTSILLDIDLNWFEFEGTEYNFIVLDNVTEQRQLEEKLRQAQKMEAIGQLSGGIAHDFNNLLTVIQGNLGMIRISTVVPGSIGEALDEIGNAVSRASNLTEQLLAFGRKQVMQSQDVELSEVVRGFSNMLRRVIGETVEVSLDFAGEGLPVRADRSMLEQAMLNLCLNARDAMPKGGVLSLKTSKVVLGPDDLKGMPSGRPGTFARLAVADSGIGIAPENLKHLFEPFYTTKEVGKGTGLGLASVFGILQQHEGWVSVQSQVGTGSTFSVYLPLRPVTRTEARPVTQKPEVPRGTETILLVEDDPAVRLVANKALLRLGYRVLVATNGKEAIELWDRCKDDVSLLLTDMVMPGGMGGAEVARTCVEQKPSIKVIFMSGYSADLAGTDIGATGGTSFLGKPFEIAELAAAIRRSMVEV